MSDDTTVNAALAACDDFIAGNSIDTTARRWRLDLPKPPCFDLDADASYFWNLATNKGDVKVRLLHESAPMHVSSTIYLTRTGFYDTLAFHRVITGFMAQGGCPLGNGRSGPGYEYDGEFDGNESHDRPGLLSMANAGPGTDGSQFFLTFVPTEWLNGKHTIFGEVVDGEQVLRALEACGSQSGTTTEELRIDKATISVE